MPSVEQSLGTKEVMKRIEPIEQRVTPHQNPAPQPTFPTYPRFLVTSLPLSVIYQPDALRQFYRGGVPQSRIIPVQTQR